MHTSHTYWRLASKHEQPAGIFRAVTAAAKQIGRVSAHKLIMRVRGDIIGKVGQRNFASVFRGLGCFVTRRSIDSLRDRVRK
jgi:hypothetical protein